MRREGARGIGRGTRTRGRGFVLGIGLGLALGLAAGCGDDLPDPGPPLERLDPPLLAGEPEALAVPLRRLTRAQLHHTVSDLLGEALPPGFDATPRLPPDDEHGGFASNSTVPPTVLAVEQLERWAEAVAAAAVPRRRHLHPCLDAPAIDSTCVHAWIDALAPRAWRRPLTTEELAGLYALAEPTRGAAAGDDDPVGAAVQRTLSGLLQSPDFLYRAERGEPTEDPAVRRLTGYELASRLSYLVWSSPPDDALWAEAASGRLHDPLVRAQQLDRMLADPKASRGLADFHRQWLELWRLASLDKDRNAFPTFDPALRPLWEQELDAFVDATLRLGDGTLRSLLLGRTTFVPPALAVWYGDGSRPATVPAERMPALPEGFTAIELDPTQRAGVLTLLPVLVAHAKADRSDPVRRGVVVRRRLLCDELVAPPQQVPMLPPRPSPGQSQRDQLEQHAEDPSCSVCHARIDPVGLVFESYDAMGSFRTQDAVGNAIDATGWVEDSDIEGAVEGAVALAEALAASEQVQRCYATQWFRYALGRPETPEDAAALQALQSRFLAADGHVPTLLRALVQSDGFAQRRDPS